MREFIIFFNPTVTAAEMIAFNNRWVDTITPEGALDQSGLLVAYNVKAGVSPVAVKATIEGDPAVSQVVNVKAKNDIQPFVPNQPLTNVNPVVQPTDVITQGLYSEVQNVIGDAKNMPLWGWGVAAFILAKILF